MQNNKAKIIISVILVIYILCLPLIEITVHSQMKELDLDEEKIDEIDEAFFPEKVEGVYIEVNKTTNRLHVYLNGNKVYTFKVATGRDTTLTPEGVFKVATKVKNPWYLPKNIPGGDKKNPLGTRWVGLSVPNTGGYKYGIHGTNNRASIGHHVSLGCIRMYNHDIEWLYRQIPLNTPVIIKK